MNRSLLAALILLAVLGIPAVLVVLGLLPRWSTGLAGLGDLLYAAAGLAAVGLLFWRWRRQANGKPLPGILTRQGLTVVMVGLSGLIVLAIFAPRFPESSLGAFAGGIGAIVLFTLIPLGLLAYIRRTLN